MKSFQRAQLAFTSHLRDLSSSPEIASLENRRLGIYRDLIFNNLAGFIAGAFPILKSLLSEAHWQQLIRDFLIEYRAQTPYFLEISQEFLQYLDARGLRDSDPPFMRELAHYEWIELALDVADRELPPRKIAGNHPLDLQPLWVSPLAWSLAYAFPVHRLGPAYQPEITSERMTLLLAYRNRGDQVKFMELNELGFALLQYLERTPGISVNNLCEQLAQSHPHPNPDELRKATRILVSQWLDEDVLLDTAYE